MDTVFPVHDSNIERSFQFLGLKDLQRVRHVTN